MTQTKSKVVAIAQNDRAKPKPNYPRIVRDTVLILTFSSLLVFGVNRLFFPNLWARYSAPAPTPVEIAPGQYDHGAN